MYTNGLKDRFGSPLISKRELDEALDTLSISAEEKAALQQLVQGSLVGDLPIGTIVPFGGSSINDGYLLCDGSTISRTTYSKLF